jgi:hypothetical protein
VQGLLDLTQRLFKQANVRVTTHKLNDVVRQILEERRPSTASGRKARVYYATQTDVAPPTVVLFVNKEGYLDESYRRYIVNRFRETLPYGEVPIKLHVRERQRYDRNAPAPTDLTDPDKTRLAQRAQRRPTTAPKSGRTNAPRPPRKTVRKTVRKGVGQPSRKGAGQPARKGRGGAKR